MSFEQLSRQPNKSDHSAEIERLQKDVLNNNSVKWTVDLFKTDRNQNHSPIGDDGFCLVSAPKPQEPLKPSDNQKKLEQAAKDLGSKDSQSREAASLTLRDGGVEALPYLQKALKSPSAEVRRRAGDIVENYYDVFSSANSTFSEISECFKNLTHNDKIKLEFLKIFASRATIGQEPQIAKARIEEITHLLPIMSDKENPYNQERRFSRVPWLNELKKDYEQLPTIEKAYTALAKEVKDVKGIDAENATDKDLALLSYFPNLKELELCNSVITPTALKKICDITGLEKLNFYKTNITDVDMHYLKNLVKLKELSLDFTKITNSGLSELVNLSDLTELSLGNTQITAEGLKQLSNLKNLKVLNLSGTKISNEGLQYLSTLTNLTSLNLSDTNISDTGLKYLKSLKKLKVLNLSNTKVSNNGLQHLGQLESLESLNLSGIGVLSSGSVHLQNLSNLRSLYLEQDGITDDTAINIGKVKNLERLYLYKSIISPPNLLLLKAVIPNNCRIYGDPIPSKEGESEI